MNRDLFHRGKEVCCLPRSLEGRVCFGHSLWVSFLCWTEKKKDLLGTLDALDALK